MNTTITTPVLQEITELLAKEQEELKLHIINTVNNNMLIEDRYMIYARDDKPKPMLCVHLDTINTHQAPEMIVSRDLEYDAEQNILSLQEGSPLTCLGGDDRAGVWIALSLIKYMETHNDYIYDVGFFLDEEIGCLGSTDFEASEHFKLNNSTCFIGLDRKSTFGLQEAALYGTDNTELIKVFEDLGFTSTMGSITDAAMLADEGTACINLSVGYDNEHTKLEILYLDCMVDTYNTLLTLSFEDKHYKSDSVASWYSPYGSYYEDVDIYNDDDPVGEYVADLEEENRSLREALEALDVNPDDILRSM